MVDNLIPMELSENLFPELKIEITIQETLKQMTY
jgi:hypothetical protein